MATRAKIWLAAQSAVRDEVRSHRNARIWTAIKPKSYGLDADGWLIWSRAMVAAFNRAQVKNPIEIPDDTQRGYVDKPLLDFAKALRDA
jgi:hypothetical protein